MCDLRIQDVTPAAVPVLQSALERLSLDLGDTHRIDIGTLEKALFGDCPSCHGVLATGPGDALLGAALFSPVMSTTAGGAGAYVSDLWVSEPARGRSLGRKLLAHVARRSSDLWQARFIRLVSYAPNTQARVFYERLGFKGCDDELVFQISGEALAGLDG